MKAIIETIKHHRNLSNAMQWSRLITMTGTTQILVQGLGFVCGILVIRLLPAHEYAHYTLANTMLGTMTVLADGGIATGVAFHGGRVYQNPKLLGTVLVTGMELRKKFAIGSVVISVPILIFLLLYHGASWIMAILITASLIPAFYSALSGTLLQIPLKLLQDIKPLQMVDIGVNIGRLSLLFLTLFAFPWAFIAIIASGIPQIWSNVRLKKISSNYVDWKSKPDSNVRSELFVFIKLLLPGSVYFCISGQLSIWLISVFGSTESVAHIGALGRLAMILVLFHAIITTLITPRFTRLADKKNLLQKWFTKVQIGLFVLSLLIISGIWFLGPSILWVLGDEYQSFEFELLLVVIGGCINLMYGINVLLNNTRGWIIDPKISISIGIASIILGAFLIDVSTLRGVLYFNIFTVSINFFIQPLYGYIRISEMTI